MQNKDRERILEAIKNMELNPFSGDVKPIRTLKGVFRRRVGDYRIAFVIIVYPTIYDPNVRIV
ncbi:MAG: type II toxin-antitoxin system RelE family toxin [Nitrososphaerales archaeon]